MAKAPDLMLIQDILPVPTYNDIWISVLNSSTPEAHWVSRKDTTSRSQYACEFGDSCIKIMHHSEYMACYDSVEAITWHMKHGANISEYIGLHFWTGVNYRQINFILRR